MKTKPKLVKATSIKRGPKSKLSKLLDTREAFILMLNTCEYLSEKKLDMGDFLRSSIHELDAKIKEQKQQARKSHV